MNRNLRFRILTLLTASVWTAAIANMFMHNRLSAKGAVSVQLATEPKIVKILVKGDKTQPVSYVETPTTFSLAPGRRKIRIIRDGYRTHEMTIEGDAGYHINMGQIVLEPDPDLSFAKLELRMEGGSAYYYINNGLVRGEQNASINDLVVGQEYVLTVALSNETLTPRTRCRLLLKDSHSEIPHVVTIKRTKSRGGKADSLKVIPCDRAFASDKKRSSRPATGDAGTHDGLTKP